MAHNGTQPTRSTLPWSRSASQIPYTAPPLCPAATGGSRGLARPTVDPQWTQKSVAHWRWRINMSAFLYHSNSGTLSLQGRRILEWVPIICSAVRAHSNARPVPGVPSSTWTVPSGTPRRPPRQPCDLLLCYRRWISTHEQHVHL